MLTIRNPANVEGKKGLGVSYEAFVDDVQVQSPVDMLDHATFFMSQPIDHALLVMALSRCVFCMNPSGMT